MSSVVDILVDVAQVMGSAGAVVDAWSSMTTVAGFEVSSSCAPVEGPGIGAALNLGSNQVHQSMVLGCCGHVNDACACSSRYALAFDTVAEVRDCWKYSQSDGAEEE